MEQSPKLSVMVGNGNRLETEGYIRNISVNMQGAQIDLLVFLLPISEADLIIGTNGLSTVALTSMIIRISTYNFIIRF